MEGKARIILARRKAELSSRTQSSRREDRADYEATSSLPDISSIEILKKIGVSGFSDPEPGFEEPGSHHSERFCKSDQA